ncbi:hypothetical protein [Ancylomarina longa]|uniref:ATP-grasp domain-containing protein n=1 Tax=Ancylomarina longa TaxID=2487017 RepID=A0A434ATH1_9BACT|nr:hypothetical protein [Ancylomarina longa]RUT77649.1 hypothetical protein DLK05_12010 [Ancylomarina longa]
MQPTSSPNLFFYNPTCELAIANNTVSFMPNKTLALFEKDLDVLPMYFANQQDIVLVQQMPDPSFLSILESAGINYPRFLLMTEALQNKNCFSQEINQLHPWGWSPRVHYLFKQLKQKCSADFLRQENAQWKPEHRNLYSRKTALKVLSKILSSEQEQGFIEKKYIARVCYNSSEVEKLLEEWPQMVLKAPWSSSGRGLLVLRQSELNKSNKQWIQGTIAAQGYIMAEALLDKKYDFSLQFFSNAKNDLRYIGPSFFETNSNGQYVGTLLGVIPDEIKQYLPKNEIERLAKQVGQAIKQVGITDHYHGYLSVDCMLFKDKSGEIRIQACVEINLRYNMGILCHFLEKYLDQDAKGIFKTYYKPKTTFDEFHREMSSKYPLQMKNGKLLHGYLPLVSPFQDKSFGAYLILD